MRKLQINTYYLNSGELEESVSFPLGLAKVLANVLPKNIASKFDENGEQLEALVKALKAAKSEGILLEVEDEKDNERIVFSVI
jgi:hypothetical protein